ncbi:MAG: glycosyltransferase [Planctomycetes bacterium]|nr:glycosyltransferase [Planctomycetota bacterium]
MRVSVALGTFNGGRFLREQLASLARQTRAPDEVIARDDASTDGTADLLDAFAREAPFAVRVERGAANVGTSANFARAVGLCTGDLIFLCDQDDVWAAEKVARFAAEFEADAGAGLVASDLAVIDATGSATGRRVWADLPFARADRAHVRAGFGPRLWLRYNTLTGAALALRAGLRDALLPVPPGWGHDAWFAFAGGALAAVRLIDDPLTLYRVHPDQQIGSEPRTVRREVGAARRFDAAYFARVADRFEAAAERLAALGPRVRDPRLLALTRDKVALARSQAAMRAGLRLWRAWPAAKHLLGGRYHRLARGWKSFAADLFL